MRFNYKDKSKWLFTLEDRSVLSRISVETIEYLRLEMTGEFSFPIEIINDLKELYKADEEKGGLVLFEVTQTNNGSLFVAKEVVPIKNVTKEDKRVTYLPDEEELDKAYLKTLNEKRIPLAFHTHPTIIWDNQNEIMQGINFLHSLNTSIADQAATLWCFRYNEIYFRLPELLVVRNGDPLFIGIYGGLVAPLCFTEQKDKAMKASLEKTFNGIRDWADTPDKQGILALSVLAIVFLAIRYPKVGIPSLMVAATVVPPLIYANQERNEFFGISYNSELTIHLPKIGDEEILEYERKAKEAREEIKKRNKNGQ